MRQINCGKLDMSFEYMWVIITSEVKILLMWELVNRRYFFILNWTNIFFTLPGVLFSLIRDDVGEWIALIAVIVCLYSPRHFPASYQIPCIYREELLKEGAHDVDKRLEQGFPKWFRRHIVKLWAEKPEEVSEGLYALSCGPDLRVKTCAACIVNGVWYSTMDREKYLQTQNSGVMTEGTHDGENIDFYGVLKEIIELQYNSNFEARWSVVLFRCDWYNQGGKTRGIRDDGHFKSINVQSLWYKTDPFILATQSRKIFYLQDTSLGKEWRVVQKFEHRNIYDVAEKDEPSHDVHQDDHCSDTEHEVQEGDVHEVTHNLQGGEATILEANLVDLIRSKKQATIPEDSEDEDEDETVLQYCSDGGNENNDDMCLDDDDEDDDF